jgi:aromatic ring hydroxylase
VPRSVEDLVGARDAIAEWARMSYGWMGRSPDCLTAKRVLDFLAGLMLKGVEATGTKDFRGVQTRIGDVLAYRNLFWGLTDAMARTPDAWVGGSVQHKLDDGLSYRVFATQAYPRGNHEAVRLEVLATAEAMGQTGAYKGFAESCMAEYDVDGWVAEDLVEATDVSRFG